MVCFYAPDRRGKNAETFLNGFDGTLQIDGYTGCNRLTSPSRIISEVGTECVLGPWDLAPGRYVADAKDEIP